MVQSASKSSLQVLFGSFSGKLINLVTLLLVTPILGPDGFGQLLIVGIILGIFNTFIDIGFENYYIIKVKLHGPEKSSPEQIKLIEDIVFSLRLYSNLILFAAQVVISYAGKGHLFEAPVDTYLRILSINYLLNIFGRINEVRFKKRMEFKCITRSKIFGDLTGAATKLILIYAGLGIIGWAYGFVAATFTTTVVLIRSSNYKPKLMTIPKAWRREVFWFAKHSWLTGLGMYLLSQANNIILKFFFPLHQSGYIQFSNSYTFDIQSGVLSSQMHVLLPYFANYQHDPDRICKGINQYLESALFVMGFPAIFGMVYGKEIIHIFFGDEWLPAYPVFMLYCAYGLVRLFFAPCLSILTSLGKMKQSSIVAYSNFILSSLALFSVGFFTRNIYWYSLVFVLMCFVGDATKAMVGLKYLKISMVTILLDVKANIICLATTIGVVLALHYLYPALNAFQIGLSLLLSASVFVGVQYMLNRKVFFLLLAKVKLIKPTSNKQVRV